MASRSRSKSKADLAADLMLAPAVIAMRLPLMAVEAQRGDPFGLETMRAVTEKTGALADGLLAAQASLVWSASRFWLDVMTGKPPQAAAGAVWGNAMEAALAPASRAVRANHKRLSRRL